MRDLKIAKNECIKEGARGVELLVADLSTSDALQAIDFESLNPGILINNAGSFLFKPLNDTSLQEFENQFHINTKSAFLTTNHVLPTFRKTGTGTDCEHMLTSIIERICT